MNPVIGKPSSDLSVQSLSYGKNLTSCAGNLRSKVLDACEANVIDLNANTVVADTIFTNQIVGLPGTSTTLVPEFYDALVGPLEEFQTVESAIAAGNYRIGVVGDADLGNVVLLQNTLIHVAEGATLNVSNVCKIDRNGNNVQLFGGNWAFAYSNPENFIMGTGNAEISHLTIDGTAITAGSTNLCTGGTSTWSNVTFTLGNTVNWEDDNVNLYSCTQTGGTSHTINNLSKGLYNSIMPGVTLITNTPNTSTVLSASTVADIMGTYGNPNPIVDTNVTILRISNSTLDGINWNFQNAQCAISISDLQTQSDVTLACYLEVFPSTNSVGVKIDNLRSETGGITVQGHEFGSTNRVEISNCTTATGVNIFADDSSSQATIQNCYIRNCVALSAAATEGFTIQQSPGGTGNGFQIENCLIDGCVLRNNGEFRISRLDGGFGSMNHCTIRNCLGSSGSNRIGTIVFSGEGNVNNFQILNNTAVTIDTDGTFGNHVNLRIRGNNLDNWTYDNTHFVGETMIQDNFTQSSTTWDLGSFNFNTVTGNDFNTFSLTTTNNFNDCNFTGNTIRNASTLTIGGLTDEVLFSGNKFISGGLSINTSGTITDLVVTGNRIASTGLRFQGSSMRDSVISNNVLISGPINFDVIAPTGTMTLDNLSISGNVVSTTDNLDFGAGGASKTDVVVSNNVVNAALNSTATIYYSGNIFKGGVAPVPNGGFAGTNVPGP